MSNYTPGPWFVGTMNDALFILDKPPRPAPIDFINPNAGLDTRVIAKLVENDRRADADARMMAGAPDMYAILDYWDVRLPPVLTDDDYAKCTVEISAGEVRRLRAALAKARGE